MISASAEVWLRWQPPEPANAGAVIRSAAQRRVERRSIAVESFRQSWRIHLCDREPMPNKKAERGQSRRGICVMTSVQSGGGRVVFNSSPNLCDPKARLLLTGLKMLADAECTHQRVRSCFVFNGFQLKAGSALQKTSTCWKPEPRRHCCLKSMALRFGWLVMINPTCSSSAEMA